MTDLQLIEKLEQHAGFVIHRLTCDGNIYADKINLNTAYSADHWLMEAFVMLRSSLSSIDEVEKAPKAVRSNMDSFDMEEWND